MRVYNQFSDELGCTHITVVTYSAQSKTSLPEDDSLCERRLNCPIWTSSQAVWRCPPSLYFLCCYGTLLLWSINIPTWATSPSMSYAHLCDFPNLPEDISRRLSRIRAIPPSSFQSTSTSSLVLHSAVASPRLHGTGMHSKRRSGQARCVLQVERISTYSESMVFRGQ